MDGSIMLYFEDIRLLYTSDYRLNNAMIHTLNSKPIKSKVDKLVIDGTFHHPSIRFLTEEQSRNMFKQFVADELDGLKQLAVGIYHVGTCDLFKSMGIKFRIHHTISENIKKQLQVMYTDLIVETSRFMLVNPRLFRKLDEFNHVKTIVPSALWFCCSGNMQYTNKCTKDIRGVYRINYTRHSDYYDNMKLIELVNAKKVDIVHDLKVNISCV
jgi:hypothetical protein